MPSQLEVALETVISVFHQYALKIGDRYMMSNKELKKLLEKELSNVLESPRDPEAMDKIMRDLDQDSDRLISLEEFLILVAKIRTTRNPSFSEETELTGGP